MTTVTEASWRSNGITAHRGNPVSAPENTLAGFESAYRTGADFIETDVRMSSDGVLFLCHDETTGRTCDKDLSIPESTATELRQLNAGIHFGKVEPIPSLDEALEWLAAHPEIRMSLQPKCPAVAEICAAVRAAGVADRIAFNDGNFDYMAQARQLIPGTLIFYDIFRPDSLEREIARALEAGFYGVVAHQNDLTPERVKLIEQSGLESGVWTVNAADALRRFFDMGVSRVYTDDPALAMRLRSERAAAGKLS